MTYIDYNYNKIVENENIWYAQTIPMKIGNENLTRWKSIGRSLAIRV
jgi:hypothetical protein